METLSEQRQGIFLTRKELTIARNSGVLMGGQGLKDGRSHYIQYAPSEIVNLSVRVNENEYKGVKRIEHGRPCGVVILHTPEEDQVRQDFFPEEIREFKIVED